MAWSPLGFNVESDGGERLYFSDAEFVVRAAASATAGAISIVEEIAPLDTPLHVHEREDEIFYVLDGDHVVQVGEAEFQVGPGGLVFAPRGVAHSQRRLVPRTGRLLTMFLPGGFDGFYRELSEVEAAGVIGPHAYARVSKKYGITWLR